MDSQVEFKIRRENIKNHKIEAPLYDTRHSELFNLYEQRRIARDIQLVKQIARMGKGKGQSITVLDVGCGTGNLTQKLIGKRFMVMGVDSSLHMLNVCRHKVRHQAKLVCADIDYFLRLNKPASFDIITLCSVLHHFPDYMMTLRKSVNLLTENGTVYITHEPLPPTTREQRSSLQVFVSRFGKVMNFARMSLRGVRVPSLNYRWSDFHAQKGINPTELLKLLNSHGLSLVKQEKYVIENSAISAYINNRMINGAPNGFSIIASKFLISKLEKAGLTLV